MNTALATTNLFDASDKQYLSFLSHAKNKISTTRTRIIRSASRDQFNLYWWLGEQIVAAQEKFGWGRI